MSEPPVPTTVLCDGCGDVIPRRMVERAGPDLLCPVCFNQVEIVNPPSPAVMIADLRVLEHELRPGAWDGQ